jgi:hypothetical protein
LPEERSPDREEIRAGRDLSTPVTRGILSLWAQEGKWAEITVSGISMSPLIPDGSRLTVRFGREGLAVGDVVLYTTPVHLVAHRVLRLGHGGRRWGWVKVKGDPLHAFDAAWIPVEDVVGRVVAVRRPDGTAVLLNTSAGRLANRLAALVSGPVGWVEGKARSLAGGSRRLHLTPSLLSLLVPLYRRRSGAGRRRAHSILAEEDRFLLAAARLRMDSEETGGLRRLLGRDLPWERIVPAATRLGLAPLVYRNLGREGLREGVPPAALTALSRGAHGAACLMAIQMDGLGRIVASLRRRGIDPILLKGAALAVTLYDQPALRPMQDLDLLVHPDEVAPALEALEEMGLRGIPTQRGARFYDSHHHAVPMIDRSGRLIVEIHRGLIPPPGEGVRLELGPLLKRAVEVERDGRVFRVLSVEDQVLHAALHLAYTDRFLGRLRDLLDVHALVGSTRHLDWGTVLESARSWEVSRSLFSTMDLARRLLSTAVPQEVLSELSRSARWDPLAATVLRVLARSSLFTTSPSGRLLSEAVARSVCDAMIKRPRWSARLRDLLVFLASPQQISA